MERAVTLTHLGSDESVDELDRRELLTGEAVGLDLRPAGFALRAEPCERSSSALKPRSEP